MFTVTVLQAAEAVISSVKPGILSNQVLQQLSALFPDSLILAALDLIDRECVIKYIVPDHRPCYQVLGSTATYTVLLFLPSPTKAYCTCPAFLYAVLKAESHLMCKHILATRLAQQLGKCVERTVTRDDLVAIMV